MAAAVAPQGGRVGALVGIRCQGERRAPSARPQKKGRRHAFTVSPVHDRRKAPISTTQAERRTASCSAFSHLEAWGCATSCVGRSTHGGDAGPGQHVPDRHPAPGSQESTAAEPGALSPPGRKTKTSLPPFPRRGEPWPVGRSGHCQPRRLRARNVPLSHVRYLPRRRGNLRPSVVCGDGRRASKSAARVNASRCSPG